MPVFPHHYRGWYRGVRLCKVEQNFNLYLFSIIAILFGVLGMTVEEASQEFIIIYADVFGDATLSQVERSLKLEKVIQNLLERHQIPPDTTLLREAPSGSTTRT